jgi:hypothetical protein
MNSTPTMEHRRGQLKRGVRVASCNVTVHNRNGCLTLAIKDVNPRVPEGNYTLANRRWSAADSVEKRQGRLDPPSLKEKEKPASAEQSLSVPCGPAISGRRCWGARPYRRHRLDNGARLRPTPW